MRPHASQNNTDANAAAAEGAKGAVYGATKFGLPLLLASVLLPHFSPLYRSLTVQFRVFIVMSGMTLGGMIEADRRVREYERLVRRRRKEERGREVGEGVWRRWEGLVGEEKGRGRGGGEGGEGGDEGGG